MTLLCATVAFAGNGKRRPAGNHVPPPPLQCFGGELEARGHAITVFPNLGHPLGKEDVKYVAALASQDPVRVSQVFNLFKDAKYKRVLDLQIDPEATAAGFKSLKNFAKKRKFTTPVPLKLTAVLDKDEKEVKHEAQAVIDELNGSDLRDYKTKIVGEWSGKSDSGDEIVGFQMELEGKTIISAIQFHDGAQDCLQLDSKVTRRILPVGIDKKMIPNDYPLELPIEPPFKVTYFYGPRIFNSNNLSIGLEENPDRIPKALPSKEKNPMDFLNKFWQVHTGVDFAVGPGTPVYAPYDGVVFAMGPMGCAGNTVVISHTIPEANNKVIFSVYEHLMGHSAAKVIVNQDGSIRAYRQGERMKKGQKMRLIQVGDPVVQGQLIAKSGASGTRIGFSHGFKEGCVGGPHLHFELRALKDNNGDLQRELASIGRGHKYVDMGRRFHFVEQETIALNPADFIYDVDEACQTRKGVELQNAIALRKQDFKKIPPMTAGLCSYKYEKSLKSVPSVYRLSRRKTDFIDSDDVNDKLANTQTH